MDIIWVFFSANVVFAYHFVTRPLSIPIGVSSGIG